MLFNSLAAKPLVFRMFFLSRFASHSFFIVLILSSIAVMGSSQAKTINTYQTAVLVENTASNKSFIIKQAFAQILAINTGEPLLSILQNPIVDQASITSGIKRSYFEKIESKYLSSKTPKFWFRVVMDENYIEKAISEAGFSLLPHDRQQIMLWVVKENTALQQLENNNPDLTFQPIPQQKLEYAYTDEKLMYWIQQWAEVVGMVVVLPEIDEYDRTQVPEESIKKLAFNAIEQAKSRYEIDLNLMIYLHRTEETVKVRSGFEINDENLSIKHYQEPLQSEEEILFAVMAELSEKYAEHYKVDFSDLQKHTVQFIISAIENYDEVQEIENYLQNLSVIEDYTIESASLGQLILRVNLAITNEVFLSIIERDHFLFQEANNSLNQLLFSRERP